jgi:hypothetical protein
MTPDDRHRPVLLTFKFLGTSLAGSLVMALVAVFAPPGAQVAVLGAFVSILGGLFLSYLDQEEQRERRRAEVLAGLAVPLSLAPDRELYEQYQAISTSLAELARHADPILRAMALLKLSSLAEEVASLAGGTVVFQGTEAWRTVYEGLLRSPSLRQYRSVAWVKSKDYWQDQPGRQSMRVNFERAHSGLLIERMVILRDDLWPRDRLLPKEEILPWVEEQHGHGLWLCLLRESDLAAEPDLLVDLGIYGDRAAGVQELDERSRTVRFTLSFEPQAVRLAEEKWRRVCLYGTPFRSLLDSQEVDG